MKNIEEKYEIKNLPKSYNLNNKRLRATIEMIYRERANRGPFKAILVVNILATKDSISKKMEVWSSSIENNESVPIITSSKDVHKVVTLLLNKIKENVEKIELKGSGYIIKTYGSPYILMMKYQTLKGKSYIELPKKIQNKKACTNVKNTMTNVLCGQYCQLYINQLHIQIV